MIKVTSYLRITCSILIVVLGFWSVSDASDIVKGESQVSKNETFGVEFNKGLLSVDIRDANVTKVFKELEKKAKIEIINQGILPDRKVSMKFHGLKLRNGIKELIRVSGISNYIIIYKDREDVITRLILVKSRPSDAKIKEIDLKERCIDEGEMPEVLDRDIDRARREAIMKTLTPMLNKVDKETQEAIKKDIMKGKVEPFED
ncbi:MAG: hypothetical protein LWW99_03665 [Deltaproteobacteria bacterium]|nr:hypothetical protein [Deltaproteobacteria bacterium]